MIFSLLDKLFIKLDRKRIIYDRQGHEPYLTRYYLFIKDRKKFPFNVMLHKIHRSDSDPELHDHPWNFFTIILNGGYWEWTPIYNSVGEYISDKKTWKGPGSIIFHKSTDYHRLELPDNTTTTTLFFMGSQLREWGFLLKSNIWQHWKEYLDKKLIKTN